MALKELAIRVDAGTHLGMGHLMRCYSVALVLPEHLRPHFYLLETDAPVRTFLENHQLRFTFLPKTSNEEEDAAQFLASIETCAAVLLDSYTLQTNWQKAIKKRGHTLYVIDDLHAWHHVADHAINHSGGAKAEDYRCENYTQLHLGYAYRMLRPSFMKGPALRSRPLQFPGKVLISMGASDVPNNTLKLAEACIALKDIREINLLISRLNPHYESLKKWGVSQPELIRLHEDLDEKKLHALMSNCDTLICPASTIALEGCSVGMIVMTGITAENQRDNYAGLIKRGLAHGLGELQLIDKDALQLIAINLDNSYFQAMTQAQNVQFHHPDHPLHSLFDYELRLANETDLLLLWEWANDALVRENSFQKEPIPLEEHQVWFFGKLKSSSTRLMILEYNCQPAGVIRFEIDGSEATLHYSIAQSFRGKSLGKVIIQCGCSYIAQHCPEVMRIVAWVKHDNIASRKSFVGFEEHFHPEHFEYVLHLNSGSTGTSAS